MNIAQLNDLDRPLMEETIRLYEHEPDLQNLPSILFDTVARLIDADVVTYVEFHHKSKDFRALVSVEDDSLREERAWLPTPAICTAILSGRTPQSFMATRRCGNQIFSMTRPISTFRS